jgi:outer membrane receptor for ferrienterochelin and colicins
LHLYFVDVNHNLRGNPNLRAEYSHSFNVQLAWQLIQSAGVWKAEAAGYFNDVHNLISLAVVDASQLLYTYVNIGRVQTLGVRAEASLRTQRMGVVVGGQYAGSGTPEARSKGVPTFAWSPEARLNADWQVPVADVRIALFYKYTGPVQAYQVDDAGGAYRTHISGFQTVDITATRHFWKQRVRLTIGIRNLANVQNVASTVAGVGAHSSSSGSIPQGTGRAAILNLSIAY